jgi:hypothetical protein
MKKLWKVTLRKKETSEAVMCIEAETDEGAIDRAWLSKPDFYLTGSSEYDEEAEELTVEEVQS